MKKYNLSEIMHKAWKLYRKGVSSFAEALHRAWNSAKAAPVNAQRIEEAQQAAGITEPVNTWAGWKAAGYIVEHGAKALFQAVLIHSSKGDGQTYRASFFGASQVQPLEAVVRVRQACSVPVAVPISCRVPLRCWRRCFWCPR